MTLKSEGFAVRLRSQSPRRGRRPEGQPHYSFLFLLFLLALRFDGAKLWKLRKSPWQLAVGLAVGGWLCTHVSFVRLCLKVSRLKWGFSRTATSLGMPASTLLLLRVQGNSCSAVTPCWTGRWRKRAAIRTPLAATKCFVWTNVRHKLHSWNCCARCSSCFASMRFGVSRASLIHSRCCLIGPRLFFCTSGQDNGSPGHLRVISSTAWWKVPTSKLPLKQKTTPEPAAWKYSNFFHPGWIPTKKHVILI